MNSILILLGAGVIGLLIGGLTSVFGVGGGFLMTPALMIMLGVSAKTAVGTGLLAIVCNSTIALYKRKEISTIDIKLALFISTGSIIGVLAGSALLEFLSNYGTVMVWGKEQNLVQYSLLWLFLALLVFLAAYLQYDYIKSNGQTPEKRVGLFSRFKLGPFLNFSSLEEPRLSVTALLGMGFFIGILIGIMGVGGGVILLPALVYLVGQRTIKAVATSLVLVWISSAFAVVLKGMSGQIDYQIFLALFVSGVLGTNIGSKIALRINGPKIRKYFVYVLYFAILMIGHKLFNLTF